MAAAHAGVGYDRLLRSADRTELVVQAMVVGEVLKDQERLEDHRIDKMANAVAKRF